MKKLQRLFFAFPCLLVLAMTCAATAFAASAPSVAYRAHVATVGWQGYVYDGGTAGTTGRGLQMEALELRLGGIGGGIIANSHVQNIGWIGERNGGAVMTGTEGQGLRMEAIYLKLSGDAANSYSIEYRVHGEGYGWQGWKKDGETAGTVGQSLRIEAIEVRLVAKASIAYRAHVATIGWQGYAYNGATAGTTGRGLQMEALELRLDGAGGGIVANSHVQNIGWVGETSGARVSTGTSGQGLRMEAVYLKLTGSAAERYSIEYRAHCENIGWQDWKRDGEIAGTTGQSLRIEALEVRLKAKNGASNIVAPMQNMYCTWKSKANWSWATYTDRSGDRDYHLGLDVYGTDGIVYAMADGTVAASSKTIGGGGANGRFIVIRHTISGKTCYSFYAHLKSVEVSNGQTVGAGQRIAVAGGSGVSGGVAQENLYGTHLHFAVVDTLWTSGGYYGYAPKFEGNSIRFEGVTYYNPRYVLDNKQLP